MGLDMYLRARKFVSAHSRFLPEGEDRNEFERLVELFGVGDYLDPGSPSAFAEFTVGYWRKANAIHGWFVNVVQDGVDECLPYDVSREQLGELKRTCEFVLGVRKKVGVNVRAADRVAEETLPPTEGFFFGTDDVDEWYWGDLENTVKIVDRALSMPREWHFEYQSSW